MNLTTTFIALISVSLLSNQSVAQQEPRSAFFWNNYMHTNPAMTGAVYKHQANVQWRNQWTKTNGAPTTLWANYATRIDKINSGIGASYEYDVIGVNASHTALVSYAYHIPIKNVFLSVGASAGMKTLKTDWSKFIPYQPNDPFLQPRTFDPVFQCDFGIALHAEKWNVGISATQVNSSSFRDSMNIYTNEPHFWVFADYTFDLGEKWKLTPRVQSFSDLNVTISSSVALLATYKDKFWFGAATAIPSNGGWYSVGPMIGYDVAGKFRVGYTYEHWFSNYPGMYNDGTHEIILSYQLK